ncbi:hypothetical protein CB1_000746002 [Camelus ferus]|nr:hypothetical protein CB1_000746002 [Camelus ferus]
MEALEEQTRVFFIRKTFGMNIKDVEVAVHPLVFVRKHLGDLPQAPRHLPKPPYGCRDTLSTWQGVGPMPMVQCRPRGRPGPWKPGTAAWREFGSERQGIWSRLASATIALAPPQLREKRGVPAQEWERETRSILFFGHAARADPFCAEGAFSDPVLEDAASMASQAQRRGSWRTAAPVPGAWSRLRPLCTAGRRDGAGRPCLVLPQSPGPPSGFLR